MMSGLLLLLLALAPAEPDDATPRGEASTRPAEVDEAEVNEAEVDEPGVDEVEVDEAARVAEETDGADEVAETEPTDETEGETPQPSTAPEPATEPDSEGTPLPSTEPDVADAPAPDEPTSDKKKKKKKKLSWSVGARVMTGWQARLQRPANEMQGDEGWEQGFFLRQARAKLRLDYAEVFGIRLSAELADAFDLPDFDRLPYLRNAFAKVRFHDAVRLQVGHFKRPFSRLELRSPSVLAIRGRGLANGFIVEDLAYGDRSTGAMLWGRIRPARTRWYLGAFTPALRASGVDVVGRVQTDPLEWLSVGASGGYKRIEVEGRGVDAASAGADFRVKVAGFSLLGDLVLGQDYRAEGQPWSLGLVGLARYDVDLPKKLVLQPVVSAEWADTNIEVSDNDAIRTVLGVNLVWRKRFRVMPQVELVRPRGVIDNPWVNRDTYYVMLSLEL